MAKKKSIVKKATAGTTTTKKKETRGGKNAAATRRTPGMIRKDDGEIWRYYFEHGLSFDETAEAVTQDLKAAGETRVVSGQMVRKSVKRLEQKYIDSQLDNVNERFIKELRQLQWVREQAKECFIKSKQPREKTVTTVNEMRGTNEQQDGSTNGNGFKAATRTARREVVQQNGDPRYLDVMLRTSEKIHKLLHIDAPETLQTGGQPQIVELLNDEQLHADALADLTEWQKTKQLLTANAAKS